MHVCPLLCPKIPCAWADEGQKVPCRNNAAQLETDAHSLTQPQQWQVCAWSFFWSVRLVCQIRHKEWYVCIIKLTLHKGMGRHFEELWKSSLAVSGKQTLAIFATGTDVRSNQPAMSCILLCVGQGRWLCTVMQRLPFTRPYKLGQNAWVRLGEIGWRRKDYTEGKHHQSENRVRTGVQLQAAYVMLIEGSLSWIALPTLTEFTTNCVNMSPLVLRLRHSRLRSRKTRR